MTTFLKLDKTQKIVTELPKKEFKSRKRGLIITIEGQDGSGKSTQMKLAQEYLESIGAKTLYSPWNSSEFLSPVTKEGKKEKILSPTTFSLLHATDFYLRLEQDILPAIKKGKIVLCDRYYYTGVARDTARGLEESWVYSLYERAREPDLKIYLKVPIQESLLRITQERAPKFYESGQDFTLLNSPFESFKLFGERVAEKYIEIAEMNKFKIVDGIGSIEDIHKLRIVPLIDELLKERGML